MDLMAYNYVIVFGFLVWMLIAPKGKHRSDPIMFLAYMTALLFCLVGTSEIMMIKPVPFFFTVGGVLAFCYEVVRRNIRIIIRK